MVLFASSKVSLMDLELSGEIRMIFTFEGGRRIFFMFE